MSLIDQINALDDLIAKGASVGTLRSHTASLREQAEAVEQVLSDLQKEKDTFQSSNPQVKPSDVCPYCNQLAGVLQERKRHKDFGDAGVWTHSYKCSNPSCSKGYEKDVES